ncbi:polyphosphate:AMP phosphotransferase [Rariglobus hedericola]|uniref:Polyphosphate:AMP phosphotransferase n=1 Tax=Rariglobus hedericola TaxID=2597822 RepID=A0A556QS88_9BACT|nr:polyphosphate:AMP phosphotransferase [Rariglobus hedericola]TSJ79492.1 polyphosphate:AMP phosphotransferase [Rariglobus hedericola]
MANARPVHRLSKKLYDARVPALREELVHLQVRLKEVPSKVLLILAGEEAGGRGEVINTLSGWLDPRGVETFAFRQPSDEERERPLMWRYWRCLPVNGRLGIFAGSWYTELLRAQADQGLPAATSAHHIEHIRNFEKLLVDDGTLIIKIWLHLTKGEQRLRLAELAANPDTAWRVTDEARRNHRLHDRLARSSARLRAATHRPGAQWTVIDAADPRARNLAVAGLVARKLSAHLKRLEAPRPKAPRIAAPKSLKPAGLARLLALPLDQKLSSSEYEAKREKWLGRLHRATRAAQAAQRSIVFVFEGWDAAGKGGAIRRLTSAIDAQDYRVIPVAKPTDEEKSHHYLWRFWRHVPRAGLVTVYDRSWYGRVLVERLEGFCTEPEWRRAFGEMNDFEQQLVEHGTIVVKFWMHVSADEQLKRFREREHTAYKQHKINAEDWRNRRKWHPYEIAVGDMLALTDTPSAPWHLIPANNKRHARLQILKTAAKSIEDALGL